MPKFACMSHHAFKRVCQRTKMSWQAVANLLDRKVYVDSGHLPGFSRHHLVFYSAVDRTCFVAIQDIHSGTIITVLPLDYQARLTWAISNETCERAKALYEQDASQTTKLATEQDANKQLAIAAKIASERSFVVSMHYVDTEGHFKTRKLMSIRAATYDFEVENLLKDKDFPDLLQNRFEQIKVKATCIDSLTIRSGKTAPAVVINLH